jgi:hypothetical protein
MPEKIQGVPTMPKHQNLWSAVTVAIAHGCRIQSVLPAALMASAR